MKLAFMTALLVGSAVGAAQTRPAADLIITNGKLYTVDKNHPRAEALAVIGDRIVAVGTAVEIDAWRGPNTRVVDALVIVPVCPHSLTHRPLVVKDTVEITILVKSAGEEAFLSIDGQVGVPLNDEDRIVCRKSEYSTTLLRMRKTFFDVLRTKLKLGMR